MIIALWMDHSADHSSGKWPITWKPSIRNARSDSMPTAPPSLRIHLPAPARVYTGIFLFFLVPMVSAQASLNEVRKKADRYFEQADYRSALHFYNQAGLENSPDKQVRLRFAITMYEANDVDGALHLLTTLTREGKTETDVFFHTAKCLEAKNRFAEAITAYKTFLQRSKPNDPRRPWVKDQLIRCANGLRLIYADELTYVENAGPLLNTIHREYGVRNSPTTIGRIYFNSDQEDVAIHKIANGNVDIYTSSLDNGRWTKPALLPSHINTPKDEEVIGFSTHGQVLYYLMQQGTQLRIRTDTFSGTPDRSFKGYFRSPADPNTDAGDFTFFNDSILLFSSNKPGGYGGYDLYISFLENHVWSEGINLGPVINSFYNERYPFLTRNGLTLFYSSDNLQSVGGFDIFTASFDPEKKTWSLPENLGFPVNSAGNETYMDVAPDGMTAFLTSDRKNGFGQEDLYRVFFKQPLQAHQEISVMPTFQQFLLSREIQSTAQQPPAPVIEKKEYYISHLFFENTTDILTPQNVKKLDLLVNLMQIYPKISAELSCFEIPSNQRTYNVYYSIKKTEEAASYLMRKGIPANRIIRKGYGSSFPIALLPAGMTHHPLYIRLNQRIEITLHDYKEEPVIIHMENIQVPENMQDERGFRFASLRHGFYYSVQLTSITQILQNNALESLEELFIEVDPANGHYLYMSGMITTFSEAEESRSQMVEAGFPEAEIIPYLNGIRIQKEDIPSLINIYPDLEFYNTSLKN
jgi:outer membrane protein OmpA-like peptidoglycan-associated protein